MTVLTAHDVAQATGGTLHGVDGGTVATSIAFDSRAVTPGAMFVAITGERTDGHRHAAAAVESGAAFVLAHEAVAAPHVLVANTQTALGDLARVHLAGLRAAGDVTVVGITGSAGKTTTKDLVAHLLSDRSTIAPAGSFNSEIGLPLTVLTADADTRALVLEMGASAVGDLTYLTGIAPLDLAVVLTVGSAHLGGFGSHEAVAAAKSELVSTLPATGVAILNADDQRVAAMASLAPGRVVTFGSTASAQVRATNPLVDDQGRASFTLSVAGESAPVALQLVGVHHVTNALAAAAVGIELGLSVARVAELLSTATAASPHRMAVVERADGITIIDDAYNANPESMAAALRVLARIAGRTRRSVAVLGAMRELGEESWSAHETIGLQVVRLNVGLTVVVGAEARAIAVAAMREGSWGDEVIEVPDMPAAQAVLDELLAPGDVVLVKASNGTELWRLATALTEQGGKA